MIIDTILACASGCAVIDQAQQYALAEELGRIASNINTTILTISHINQLLLVHVVENRLFISHELRSCAMAFS